MPTDSAKPSSDMDNRILPGMDVFTADGKRLGCVKESIGTHFKVDARWRRDYWLERDQVRGIESDRVGMLFTSTEASLYRLPKPLPVGYDRPIETPTLTDERGDVGYRGRYGV